MAFDPDKYLASRPFDPDEYLRGSAEQMPPPMPSQQFRPSPTGSRIDQFLAGLPDIQASSGGRMLQTMGALPLMATQAYARAVGAPDRVGQMLDKTTSLRKRRGSEGIDWWGVAGHLVSPTNIGLVKSLSAAPSALGRIGQGSGIGVVTGAQPLSEDSSSATNLGNQAMGAAVGALLPAGLELGRKAVSFGRNIVQPMLGPAGIDRATGRTLNVVAGDRRQAVIDALQKSAPDVPGAPLTSGQASVPANSAEFAGLQTIIGQRNPSVFYGPGGVDGAQEAARRAAIKSFAGNANQRAAVVSALRSTTDPMREQALTSANAARLAPLESAPILQRIGSITSRPGDRANDVLTQTLGDLGEKVKRLTRADGTIDARDLYTIRKQDIGLLVSKYTQGMQGWDKRRIASLENEVKGLIDDLIENAGGTGWKNYLSTYAQGMRQVNQKEIGERLLKALQSSTGAERPVVYGNAVRTATEGMRTSSGISRFGDIKDVLTPDQMRSVNNVAASLKNNAEFEKLSKVGLPQARSLLGQAEDTMPQINLLSRAMTIYNRISRRLEGVGGERVMRRLSDVMQDPKETARLMAAATPKERSELIDALMRYQSATVPSMIGIQ
jgi:hypothetical protein